MSFHEMQMCVKSEYKLTRHLTIADKMEVDNRRGKIDTNYRRRAAFTLVTPDTCSQLLISGVTRPAARARKGHIKPPHLYTGPSLQPSLQDAAGAPPPHPRPHLHRLRRLQVMLNIALYIIFSTR